MAQDSNWWMQGMNQMAAATAAPGAPSGYGTMAQATQPGGYGGVSSNSGAYNADTPNGAASGFGPANSGGGDASSSFFGAYAAPSRVPTPAMGQFQYSQNATSYPDYLRSIGENQAQQQFQSNVAGNVRLGNSAQGYQHAQDLQNQARLGYGAQAGQAQMGVETAQAGLVSARNQENLASFGINAGQRAGDLQYLANMYAHRFGPQTQSQILQAGGRSGSGVTNSGGFIGLNGNGETSQSQYGDPSAPSGGGSFSAYDPNYTGGYGAFPTDPTFSQGGNPLGGSFGQQIGLYGGGGNVDPSWGGGMMTGTGGDYFGAY